MRFEESIHWPEGLFLQPHHFQQLQILMEQRDRSDRALFLTHSDGLIDIVVDDDALKSHRIVLKKLSAIMPDGTEVSMPGNTSIPVLDLTKVLQQEHRDPFLIYIALPLRSEHDANLAEDGDTMGKRLFSLHETLVSDENSGDDEITFVRHRNNVRLITEFDSQTDMEVLPIMRVIPVYTEDALPNLMRDMEFIPPFLYLTSDCPLLHMATELNIQLKKRCNKLLMDLTAAQYSNETIGGTSLFNVLQLQTLFRYCNGAMGILLDAGKLTPLRLYIELHSLLSELTALQPMREMQPISAYNHYDCASQFASLMQQIRLLILEEGVSGYKRIDFVKPENGRGLLAKLDESDFSAADGWYIAIHCAGEPRRIVSAVESGDKFKMVNPNGADMRIRGVKLSEMRYPPRFLPALQDALWFSMKIEESPRVWDCIRRETAILLDWGEGLFPALEATLFITTLKQEHDK